MAYTNTPEKSTYRTERIDFVGVPTQRNGTVVNKDQRYVNAYPERVKDTTEATKRWYLRTRPGTNWISSVAAGEGRGIAYFNGDTYSAVGNKLYRNTTEVATLGNSSGRVGFTQFNGTYTALIVLDGVKGFVIKTDNTVTEITDPDFPTPHSPYPIFLDGYVFVAKADTDDIYNSNLEDPLTWDPSKFITAEIYPDKIMALAKNGNYVVAVGERTVEQFYDAGIASGSPLQRVDSAVQQVGTPAPKTVVTSDAEVFFVGQTSNGGRTVWSLAQYQLKEISTPVIRQVLNAVSAITDAVGTVVRVQGHKFYVISLPTRTLVYDVDEQMWHEWATTTDTTPFFCKYSCDHAYGASRWLHPTNGSLLEMVDTHTWDTTSSGVTVNLPVSVTTEKLDFKSTNRKFMYRLAIVGDAPDTSDVPISVQWSDDDYQSWSPARTIQLHGDHQALTQGGMFRRRAFKFSYNQPYALRLEAFELDVNIGQS